MNIDYPRSKTAVSGTGLAATLVLAGGMLALMLSNRKHRQRQGDDAPGRTARRQFGEYEVTGRTVTIARPRQELYAFWRNFENLSQFMENVESVQSVGGDRSVWKIKAPAGQLVDIETEVVSEEDGHLIAWRSVEGSEIETEGRVTFEDAPVDRGTRVGVIISYKPPAGIIGKAIAKLFLREPSVQARHDLKRFKMLMEAGEIATSARRREDSRAERQADKWHEKEEA